MVLHAQRLVSWVFVMLGWSACSEPVGPAEVHDADFSPDTDVVLLRDADRADADRTDADERRHDGDLFDAGRADGDARDADEPDADDPLDERPPYWRLTLEDGREVVGEHVATYDHRIWWNPSDQLTYALFEPGQFFDYPDDRSLTFTSSLVVEAMVEETLPVGTTPYGELLRSHGIVVERVPLEGVVFVITGNEGYHLEENGYGDFAIDFVRTDAAGRRFTGDGGANEDFLVWDDEVFMPTEGYVVEVVRDGPDNDPGEYPDGAVNNMVGVHLGGSFYLYLLHFRQDTIPDEVIVGATLDRGSYLGRVGNAGVSLEPHLHMALLWYDESTAAPRSWSVPVELAGVHTAPTATGPSTFQAYCAPLGGTWISGEAF